MSLRLHVRTKGGKKKFFFERSLATTVSVKEKKSIYPAGGCRCHFVLIPWLSMEKNNLVLPSRNIHIGYVHLLIPSALLNQSPDPQRIYICVE